MGIEKRKEGEQQCRIATDMDSTRMIPYCKFRRWLSQYSVHGNRHGEALHLLSAHLHKLNCINPLMT